MKKKVIIISVIVIFVLYIRTIIFINRKENKKLVEEKNNIIEKNNIKEETKIESNESNVVEDESLLFFSFVSLLSSITFDSLDSILVSSLILFFSIILFFSSTNFLFSFLFINIIVLIYNTNITITDIMITFFFIDNHLSFDDMLPLK